MLSKKANYIIIPIALFFVIESFTACSSSANLQSKWANTEMKIDGDFPDWENSLHAIKDEGVSLGFKNDDKFLYLCLMTVDQGKMMQMMRSGFIIWFIPQNDDGKIFGIKYPMPHSMLSLDREERQDFNKDLFKPEKMQSMFSKMLGEKTEFQIINEESFPLGQYGLQNKEGITAKLGYISERFIYELQIPLGTSNNYSNSIASQPGEKLKIKFETLESEFGGMLGDGMGTRMKPPGGSSPNEKEAEGQRADGGKRRKEDGQFSRPEPFNYVVQLQLQKQ